MTWIREITRSLIILMGILFFTMPIYSSSLFAFQSEEGSFTLNPLRNAGANTELVNGPSRRTYWGNRTYELLTKENMELIGKVIDLKENE